ncbi:hypothetical protein JNUCC42_13375 [Brevibacterium sp. JNUCC-42]|nr:hypothetical protein JNUCC42_13375 [Brevibacterium sp. JNUCC-42]
MNGTAAYLKESRKIERYHMKLRRRSIYVACEDYNFIWCEHEIRTVRKMWKNGISIVEMAKIVRRHLNELAFLIIDQAESTKFLKSRRKKVTNDASAFKNFASEKIVYLQQEKYIACEYYNFVWDEDEVYKFRNLWSSGATIFYISEVFNRDVNEVAFLIVDQADQGYIKPRKGGVWGVLFESQQG